MRTKIEDKPDARRMVVSSRGTGHFCESHTVTLATKSYLAPGDADPSTGPRLSARPEATLCVAP